MKVNVKGRIIEINDELAETYEKYVHEKLDEKHILYFVSAKKCDAFYNLDVVSVFNHMTDSEVATLIKRCVREEIIPLGGDIV